MLATGITVVWAVTIAIMIIHTLWTFWKVGTYDPEFETPTKEVQIASDEFHKEVDEYVQMFTRPHNEINRNEFEIHAVDHIPPDLSGTMAGVYGIHIPRGPELKDVILINERAHQQPDAEPLHETVCHELAHYLDQKRRGRSGHDAVFEETMKEIKLVATGGKATITDL